MEEGKNKKVQSTNLGNWLVFIAAIISLPTALISLIVAIMDGKFGIPENSLLNEIDQAEMITISGGEEKFRIGLTMDQAVF